MTILTYLGKFPSPKSSLLLPTCQQEFSVEERVFSQNGKEEGRGNITRYFQQKRILFILLWFDYYI